MIAARRYYGNLSRQQFQMKVDLWLLKKSMYLSDSSVSPLQSELKRKEVNRAVLREKYIFLLFALGKCISGLSLAIRYPAKNLSGT